MTDQDCAAQHDPPASELHENKTPSGTFVVLSIFAGQMARYLKAGKSMIIIKERSIYLQWSRILYIINIKEQLKLPDGQLIYSNYHNLALQKQE